MTAGSYTDPDGVQRAIVLQVLRDDRIERWTRKEVKRELHDVKGRAINKALDCLEAEGVVELDGEDVWASRCARHLDALGMVSV
jgi:hypothetical protein